MIARLYVLGYKCSESREYTCTCYPGCPCPAEVAGMADSVNRDTGHLSQWYSFGASYGAGQRDACVSEE